MMHKKNLLSFVRRLAFATLKQTGAKNRTARSLGMSKRTVNSSRYQFIGRENMGEHISQTTEFKQETKKL